MNRRTSRRTRRRNRALRLRERDLEVLLALAKMRLLRTGEIARLFFGAVGTAQKRLRKLYDGGLIRALVTDLAAENRYAITPIGHALLARALPQEGIPAFRAAPRVDGRSMAHLDLLNSYRIALASAAPAASVDLLQFTPEWELRSREPSAAIVPDAVFRLRHGSRVIAIALEVDAATEPPMTVVRKMERYQAHALERRPVGGLREPRVLLIVPSRRRARSLARALEGGFEQTLIGWGPEVLKDGGLRSGLSTVREVLETDGLVIRATHGLLD